MAAPLSYPPPAVTDVPQSSCYLVWLPDDPVYRAAFWGAYSELSSSWQWDEDDPERKAEIEQSWLSAIFQTLECVSMTCLEDVLAELAAIRAAIYANACCGDTVISSTVYNTVITPGEGDPPATWGDGEAVADWADWHALACSASHDFVDGLRDVAIAARESLLAASLGLTAVLEWLRRVTFLSLALDIANSLGQSVWSAILEGGASNWDGVADALEDARTDIVCAILSDGDIAQTVQDAVGLPAWIVFYSRIDYDTLRAIIYEGSAYGQSLPTAREVCDCDPDQLGYWTFLTDLDGWTVQTAGVVWANVGSPDPGAMSMGSISGRRYVYSPSFTIAATANVYLSFMTRLFSGGAYTGYAQLIDATTLAVVRSFSNWSEGTGTWVEKNLSTANVPAGDYRLRFGTKAVYIDTVEIRTG